MDRTDKARQVVDEHVRQSGSMEPAAIDALADEHPDLMPELEQQLGMLGLIRDARRRAESGVRLDAAESADTAASAVAAAIPPAGSFPGYEVIRQIKRGGQGVVYEATQVGTQRKIAIKVMREGPFAGPRDKARFELEVQILGALKHPHIVTIHDSGTAGDLGYYVMDYIEGLPLDLYGAEAKLSIDDALRLFVKICDAVSAAHLRGVIHRDLKPGNIRVDADGQPHVLDFGLARVTAENEHLGANAAAMTMTGQFVGSLPWVSPEQTEGSSTDLDVRTDVYSLGVVLYQLLTRRFPYDVGGGVRETMENIVSAEPVMPSSIRSDINDEVETILLTCMSKERERRYQSAGDLAREIRRYLAGEPIESKRDSSWYVLKKTLRRYRLQATAAAIIVVLVLVFAVTMSVMYSRKVDADREFVYRARCAGLAAGALEQVVFFERLGERKLDAELLRSRAEYTLAGLAEHPVAQAMFMDSVASTAAGRGFDELALDWRHRAYERWKAGAGSDDAGTATACYNLANYLYGARRFEEAEVLGREALAMRRRILGDDHPDVATTLHALSAVFSKDKRPGERVRLMREALEIRRRAHPDGHADTVTSLCSLAQLVGNDGKPDGYREAEALYREALAMAGRKLPHDHARNARVMSGLGQILHWTGRSKEGTSHLREALDLAQRAYPLNHPSLAGYLSELGLAYKDSGDYAAAEPLLLEALEISRRVYGDDHGRMRGQWHTLAKLYTDSGRYHEAEQACRKSLLIHIKHLGPDHRETARPMTHLGKILVAMDRYEEAVPLLEDALVIRKKEKPPGHWKTAKTMSILGSAYVGLGRFEEAEPLLLQSYPDIEEDREETHRRTREAMLRIVSLYEAWGKPDEALPWREKFQAAEAAALDAGFPSAIVVPARVPETADPSQVAP